jgi:serine/threonine protein kinase
MICLITHRDIKPENIFVSDDFTELIVGDLGTAKEQFELSTTIAGTPMYLSPILRQSYISFISGNNRVFQHDSFKSDVYSLGLTFLYMASLKECSDLLNISNLAEKTRLRINEISWYPNLQPILRKMLAESEADRDSFKDIYRSLQKFNLRAPIIVKTCIICCKLNEEGIVFIGSNSVCNMCWESFKGKIWTFCEVCIEYPKQSLCLGYHNINKCQYCKKNKHSGYSCFAFRNSPNDLKCGICALSGNKFSSTSTNGFWVTCQIGHNYCVVCNRGIGYNHMLCSLVMNTSID